MIKQPIYSVIIPHYNSPDLLVRCLASIPDCEDIQVIVVDDNSSSDIVDFTNFPGSERKNTIIIYNKNNKGAGQARNLGLEQAQGKWLIFADTDDFFLPTAWERIFSIVNEQYDIIYLGIDSVDSDTLHPTSRCTFIKDLLAKAYNTPSPQNKEELRLRHIVPWGKIIRASLIQNNHIRFEETKYSNDVMFSTYVGLSAQSIYIDITPCYCVTSRVGSLTSSTSSEVLCTRFEVTAQRNQLLRQKGYAYYQIPIATYMYLALRMNLKTFFRLLCIGMRYHTRFFLGFQRWGNRLFNIIVHHKHPPIPWQQ